MSVKFIADVGSNHNQDINRIEKLIIIAKEMGCHAVKFQLFRGDKLYAPEFPEKIKEAHAQELSLKFIPKIFAICHAHKIEFHCTPFDLEAVEILKPYVDQFKISSYDILNLDLIKVCLETDKPLGISFGNWKDEKEILNIINFIEYHPLYFLYIKRGLLTLYHCISKYPAKAEECNMENTFYLMQLRTSKWSETIKFGWSDHTVQPGVIYAAAANEIDCIEFHLDLEDGQGLEYKHGHCWRPSQIKSVIKTVRVMEAANTPIIEKLPSDNYKWRSDSEDGMRPLKEFRKDLSQKEFLKDISD